MAADVGDVNDRLNGLVSLLQSVGVDSIDSNEVDRVSKSLQKGNILLPDTRQLNDDQIEVIIEKLQQARAQAPEIIKALESQRQEVRSKPDGAGAGRNGGKVVKKKKKKQLTPEQQKEKEEEEDTRRRQQELLQQHQDQEEEYEQEEGEEEDEDYDDFDEDADYPMVGEGISDDISIVSDLTTPTVVSNLYVADEEHYKEATQPYVVSGAETEDGTRPPAMMVAPPKRKNLVNQVKPVAAPPQHKSPAAAPLLQKPAPAFGIGGAAAMRRKKYQEAMALLHENPYSHTQVGPQQAQAPMVPMSALNKFKKPLPTPEPSSQTPTQSGKKTLKKGAKKKQPHDLNNSSSNLSSYSEASSKQGRKSGSGGSNKNSGGKDKPGVMIDDDGFLLGSEFDAFSSPNNPFNSDAASSAETGGTTYAATYGGDEGQQLKGSSNKTGTAASKKAGNPVKKKPPAARGAGAGNKKRPLKGQPSA